MNCFARLAIFTAIVGAFSLSARAAQAPQGSYLQTCVNVQASSAALYANCQDVNGRYHYSVLPRYQECVGDITNQNGDLTCNRQGGRNWDRNRQGWVPPGSYAETCRNIRFDDNTISAKCLTMNHRWVKTTLTNRRECIGGIINDDGNLVCTRQTPPPNGSYLQTCAPIYARNDVLRARCQTRMGSWTWTTLNDFDSCRGDISNEDGQLRCRQRGGYDRDRDRDRDRDDGDRDRDRDRDHDGDRDRNPGYGQGQDRGLPGGSYAQTCRNVVLRGNQLAGECMTTDRRWLSTSLDDVFRCRGDIANNNGQLICRQ